MSSPFDGGGGKNKTVVGIDAWEGAEDQWEKNFTKVSEADATKGDSDEIAQRANRVENAKELLVREPDGGKAAQTRGDEKYMWVMMFHNEDFAQSELEEEKKAEIVNFRRETINKMMKLGLLIFQRHKSRDDDEKYVKVGASDEWFEMKAEEQEVMVKLKNGGYVPFIRAKKSMFWSLPVADKDNYDYDNEEDYTKRIGVDPGALSGADTFRFSSAQQLQIIMEVLEAKEAFGGCGLNFGKLIKEETILQWYPAHDEKELEFLKEHWGRFGLMWPWKSFTNQPLERVREYFGTRIALYFTFLGVYTWQLVIPTLLGILTFIVDFATDGPDAKAGVPLYSFTVILWNTLLLETWKRKEITCAWLWGTIGFESEEDARPDFEGVQRKNPVTGAPELWYPEERRRAKMTGSLCLIFISILVVFSGVVLVFAFRYFIAENLGAKFAGMSGIVNGIMIVIFNALYTDLAIKLNEWENHKTDTEFDDSLIIKNFAFQFANNYGPFYLVAFLKSNANYFGVGDFLGPCLCHTFKCYPVGDEHYDASCTDVDGVGTVELCDDAAFIDKTNGCDCETQSCLEELMILLVSIFGVNLFIGNVMEFGVPYITARVNMYLEEKAMRAAMEEEGKLDGEIAPMTQCEFEGKLAIYESPFEDYNEMILQLGFVSFFAVAFPLCPLMALVNNVVEIRSDAFKLLAAHQRPEPRAAEDIGSWYTIMDIMVYISICTNCAIVFFVSSIRNDLSKDGKVWMFIICEHIVIFLKICLAEFVDDVPKDIQQEMEKEEYRLKRAAEEAALADLDLEESGAAKGHDAQDLDTSGDYINYDESDVQWMVQ